MKRHITTIAIILIFLVGLSVLLYPYVADYFNSRNQSRAVSSYRDAVGNISEADLSEMFEAARAYNDSLRGKQNRFKPTEEDLAEYRSLLNITTGGIMGTLEIGAIGVMLPIYHGTSEGALQIGAGHLEGSSLPVGGLGTHTVLTGHRGLPSSTLLTNLDRVEEGDVITLHVLNETLYYRVDRIIVVEPNDFSAMGFDMNKDYCTVFTCTPYGINSHRMLVRGYRIESPEEEIVLKPIIQSEAERIRILIIVIAVVGLSVIILMVIRLVRDLKKNKQNSEPT